MINENILAPETVGKVYVINERWHVSILNALSTASLLHLKKKKVYKLKMRKEMAIG